MRKIAYLTFSIFVAAGVAFGQGDPSAVQSVRFGITADVHLGRNSRRNREWLDQFVSNMRQWQPDFVVDLGDFGVQVQTGPTTTEAHAEQLRNLEEGCSGLARLPCPRYFVVGNHDVGWIQGDEETISDKLHVEGVHKQRSYHLSLRQKPDQRGGLQTTSNAYLSEK